MVEEKKFWKRDEVQWFVLRLKWKPVEVLEELLKAEGKETFVPRSYVLRTDSRGRKHRVLKNVLPELLFVHASFGSRSSRPLKISRSVFSIIGLTNWNWRRACM